LLTLKERVMINDFYLDAEMKAWEKASDYDCVQALIDLLDNLPVDDETWREIVEEPYG